MKNDGTSPNEKEQPGATFPQQAFHIQRRTVKQAPKFCTAVHNNKIAALHSIVSSLFKDIDTDLHARDPTVKSDTVSQNIHITE